MKNLKKEIENAANRKTKMYVGEESRLIKKSFIEGAKSDEAREFHTHTLRIEMVAKCAKMQVELKKNLYTEEEIMEKVLVLLNERYGILNPKRTISEILKQTLYTEEEVIILLADYSFCQNQNAREFFEQNKKKSWK